MLVVIEKEIIFTFYQKILHSAYFLRQTEELSPIYENRVIKYILNEITCQEAHQQRVFA